MTKLYDNYDFTRRNKPIAEVRPEIVKKRFLDIYPLVAHVGKACQVLGLCTRTFYHWKHDDPEFREAFEKADQMALGLLEDTAVLRAVYGVDKPVFQGGKLVGFMKEYSDTLLIVLLKARAPHKYKERFAGELTGADGKPLSSEHKIIHVHSNIPIAQIEERIDMNSKIEDIPHEVVENPKPPEIDELLT